MIAEKLAGWGSFLALPWCCVVPAALSFVGLGAGVAAGFTGPIAWGSAAASVLLLSRANWLVWVRRRGAAPARWGTTLFTAAAAAIWLVRLSPYLTR